MNSENTNDFLKVFAKVSIDAMKDLASKGEKLSSKTLASAMQSHKDFKTLSEKPSATQLSQSLSTEATEIENLKSQTKIIQSQKDQLLKQLQELEDRQLKSDGFYKTVVTTFINLLLSEGNYTLAPSLEQFKTLIQKENSIDIFIDAFNQIKDAALREDIPQIDRPVPDEKVKSPSFLSRLLKKPEPEALGGAQIQEIFFKHLKTAYQEIVDELSLFLGEGYLKKLSRISKQIDKCSNFDALSLVRKNILTLIQDYINKVSLERELAAEIIKEIGERLIQVEGHIKGTYSAANHTIKSSSRFNSALKKQLEELQNSVNFSKTLAELKKAVIYRLNLINETLVDKTKQDLQQKEEANKQMVSLKKALVKMKKKILFANDQSKKLAQELLTDPLTEIYNRRAYDRRIDEEMKRYLRYKNVFSLLLFDVDHFKKINDQYGHAIGDKCLKEIINRIKPALRDADFLARFGGEEFMILLPETDQKGAKEVAEKLRSLVEKIEFLHKDNPIQITVSIGVTHILPEDKDHETIFNRVDMAMYEAKNSGRNRVIAC